MKTSKELLDNLLKTTQMGQTGIRSVIDAPMRPALRQALESQLREYDAIEQEAQDIMRRRNWPASQADPVVQGLSAMVSGFCANICMLSMPVTLWEAARMSREKYPITTAMPF